MQRFVAVYQSRPTNDDSDGTTRIRGRRQTIDGSQGAQDSPPEHLEGKSRHGM